MISEEGPTYEALLLVVAALAAVGLTVGVAVSGLAIWAVGPRDRRGLILPAAAAAVALVLVSGHPGDKGVALPVQFALTAAFVTAAIQRATMVRLAASKGTTASWFSWRWCVVGASIGLLAGGAIALATGDRLPLATLAIVGGIAAGSVGARRRRSE
jgi:hypothetical protein